jgi:tetratricopeptide (TPR) repeat protein
MRSLLVVCLACVAPCVSTQAHAQPVPSIATTRQALNHYFEGQAFLSAERWTQAAREFSAAIKLHPLLTDAHYGLGHAYMGMERYTSAALAFQQCLEAARTLYGLRESARVQTDRMTLDIIDELRDTIRRRGSETLRARQLDAYVARLRAERSSLGGPFEPPPPVLLALGSAHFRLGNTRRAEYYWRDAARIDAGLGEAWNNLAVVYLETGRTSEAIEAASNAVRAGFRMNPQLWAAIERLK